MRTFLRAGLVLAAVASGASLTARPATLAAAPTPATVDEVVRNAYYAAYSLEYADATKLARQAVAMAPGESQTHRALASILWLDILFKRGACTIDNFIGGMTKSQRGGPGPAPELEAEFKAEVGKSIDLAEAHLKASPQDIEARHDVGAAYAIQASYSASIDGSLLAAFRSARRAYDAHEDVLALSPNRADANFAVGIYRYVISTLSMPSRFLAYLAGFGGGKERGINQLESTVNDPAVHVDAKAALMLIYTREGRHADALRMVTELEAEFPRNRLFTFERGAASIRAGHAEDAEAILTRGLNALDTDPRPKFPGERALWLYKRAYARVVQNHFDAARADLAAAAASEPAGWVSGRLRLELGKIADLTGHRQEAIAAYQGARTLCEQNSDIGCARAAGDYIKRPFIH